jgi:WD40 repeat protein
VDFSPDARLLAFQSEGGNNNVVIWDLEAGDRVLTLSHSPQWKGAVQFSADGTSLLTAGRDAAARIWDVATGEETMVFLGHLGVVEDAAFRPDGTMVATGGADGTIRLWEVATGQEVLALNPGISVRSVAWSPDGRQLAEAHGDPSGAGIQVWALDVDELVEIARARLQRGFTAVECETHHIDPCPAA